MFLFLRKLVLLLALVWCVFGLAREVETYRQAVADPTGSGEVAFWRLGQVRPEALRFFLEAATVEVPEMSVVVFATGTGSETQDYFLTFWAAYFLPEHRVIPLDHPEAQRAGEYLLAYNTEIDHPRLREIYRSWSGVTYRIRTPVGKTVR
ncbi:MAG: hypothetical protein AAF481_10265 [Acidobacteriota bacterium]